MVDQRCAVEMQRNADTLTVEYRVGINLGEVIAQGEDIFSDGMNIAARLEALAVPGGICISEDAYRQVRDRLDYMFGDLGEQQVKNAARPVRVGCRYVLEGSVRKSAERVRIPAS